MFLMSKLYPAKAFNSTEADWWPFAGSVLFIHLLFCIRNFNNLFNTMCTLSMKYSILSCKSLSQGHS